ncbi:MAG: peptide-N-glycosidase F-related protein [Myxococcota bacterium]
MRRLVFLGFLLSACGDSTVSSEPGAQPGPDFGVVEDQGDPEEDMGQQTDVDLGPARDMGPEDTGTPVDMGPPPPPDICDDLGLTRRVFRTDAGNVFGEVAGDFTVNEVGGASWNFRENFTGCESYVFVTYFPPDLDEPIGLGPNATGGAIFGSPVTEVVENTPLNSHFFFINDETDAELRSRRLDVIQRRLELAIGELPAQEQDRQWARFHLVLDRASDIDGSVGAMLRDYLAWRHTPASFVDLGERGMAPSPAPYFFGIDRFQRWDAGGSPAQFVGGSAHMRMASFLPLFYDHKAKIDDDSEALATQVVLLDQPVTERIFVQTVELPDADTMAGFDTLAFDVAVNCKERNVFACSEWDRIARIEHCSDETCESRQEVIRWITPYWRRGDRRWIMDASTLLGLVQDGGQQTFRIEMGPGWERKTERDARMVLRLSNEGKSERAVGAIRIAGGGSFNDAYNDREPVPFQVPDDASRVELVSILSGHGQSAGNNCSEWCDHRHRYTINQQALPVIQSAPGIGSASGCGPAAAQGVSPGQFGNWAPQRAYWCPGLPVDHIRQDITNLVTLGDENQFDYTATLGPSGAPGGGNISLSVYVVWYR